MLIDFDTLKELAIPNLNGGEGTVSAKMFMQESLKVMLSRLPAGASIGEHPHTAGFELDYVISGSGKATCSGSEESLSAGACHYCPKGAFHSISNTGMEDLILLTVVAAQ